MLAYLMEFNVFFLLSVLEEFGCRRYCYLTLLSTYQKVLSTLLHHRLILSVRSLVVLSQKWTYHHVCLTLHIGFNVLSFETNKTLVQYILLVTGYFMDFHLDIWRFFIQWYTLFVSSSTLFGKLLYSRVEQYNTW